MSRVKQIEDQVKKLSADEVKELREWLEDFLEDRMEFTPQFEATIRESEAEMKLGILD
jgi:hypothetical protein